jgi:hypothetical protein
MPNSVRPEATVGELLPTPHVLLENQRPGHTKMMPRGYRFLFFDPPRAEPVAVFKLHFLSDDIAKAEANHFLKVSSHATVEVWRGTSCLHRQQKPLGFIRDDAYPTDALWRV